MCVLRVLQKETIPESTAILKHPNYLYQRTLAASISIWFFYFVHLSPKVRHGETEEVLKREVLRWGSGKRPATDALLGLHMTCGCQAVCRAHSSHGLCHQIDLNQKPLPTTALTAQAPSGHQTPTFSTLNVKGRQATRYCNSSGVGG